MRSRGFNRGRFRRFLDSYERNEVCVRCCVAAALSLNMKSSWPAGPFFLRENWRTYQKSRRTVFAVRNRRAFRRNVAVRVDVLIVSSLVQQRRSIQHHYDSSRCSGRQIGVVYAAVTADAAVVSQHGVWQGLFLTSKLSNMTVASPRKLNLVAASSSHLIDFVLLRYVPDRADFKCMLSLNRTSQATAERKAVLDAARVRAMEGRRRRRRRHVAVAYVALAVHVVCQPIFA